MLKTKINGKYKKSAEEVAAFHGVHINSVHKSRKCEKDPNWLDRLMLFEEAKKDIRCENDSCQNHSPESEMGLVLRGRKKMIIQSMKKKMAEDKKYLVVLVKV